SDVCSSDLNALSPQEIFKTSGAGILRLWVAMIDQLRPERDVVAVVDHRHPQPENVGAVGLEDLLRRERVATRLRHLVAGLVDDEAAGDDFAIRRRPFDAGADEERRLEPAAMLVVALDVEIGRPRQLGTLLQYRELR